MNALGQPWVRISGMPPRAHVDEVHAHAVDVGDELLAFSRARARQSNAVAARQ